MVWFENRGNPSGVWNRHLIKDNWPKANQVITADLDDDGRLDIAATAESDTNEFLWWHNLGTGCELD